MFGAYGFCWFNSKIPHMRHAFKCCFVSSQNHFGSISQTKQEWNVFKSEKWCFYLVLRKLIICTLLIYDVLCCSVKCLNDPQTMFSFFLSFVWMQPRRIDNGTEWCFFWSGKKSTKDNLTHLTFKWSDDFLQQILDDDDDDANRLLFFGFSTILIFLKKKWERKLPWKKFKNWTVEVLIRTFCHLFMFKINCVDVWRKKTQPLKWLHFPIRYWGGNGDERMALTFDSFLIPQCDLMIVLIPLFSVYYNTIQLLHQKTAV